MPFKRQQQQQQHVFNRRMSSSSTTSSDAYINSGTRMKRRKMVVDCKALRAKVHPLCRLFLLYFVENCFFRLSFLRFLTIFELFLQIFEFEQDFVRSNNRVPKV